MANIVSMIVLAIMTHQSITAVEIGTHTLLKYETTLHSNGESNVLSQDSQMLCSYLYGKILTCQQGEPLLTAGYCATYNDHKKLVSILECPFFESNGYNYTSQGSVLLPKNLSELNDYMCGPLNRKGLVCSECGDGFGPSVTSFGYRCVKCKDSWYGVPLFLFIKLFPITILYLVILVLQIRVTSPPTPCLIMFAQTILIAFDPNMVVHEETQVIFKDRWKLRLDMKIILSLYWILNLDLVQNLLAPYCVSNKLKFIHIAFLDYISAFYPLLLICLTWTCVELHGRNFGPLVWLWRPFHRCFVRLRRGWDTKSDIIDVFTTFFFLTYSKILYQTLLLVINRPIKNIELSGQYFLTYVPVVDQSVKFGGVYHLSLAIPGIFVFLVFNILPPLVLTFYPVRIFRKCLSKCHLNLVVVNIFLDKVYACYRNGLNGGRDMRSFSGIYLFLQVIGYCTYSLLHAVRPYLGISPLFGSGTLTFIVMLVVAIGKPYRKAYMNHLDTLLLSNFMILSYVLSSGTSALVVTRTLIATPITVFTTIIIMRRLYDVFRLHLYHKLKLSLCNREYFNHFRYHTTNESTQNSAANTPTSAQPLLQPTSTIFSYSTDN